MGEIKLNMYVRTKNGIGKIDGTQMFMEKYFQFHLDTNKGSILCISDNSYWNKIEDIIGEPSYNIIDLIEVGDYVNGERVSDFDVTYFNGTDRLNEPKRIGVIVGNYEMFKFSYHIKKEDIKSIVTHEQFESMAYKVY